MEVGALPEERGRELDRLGAFVAERVRGGREAALTFVCTHNSRRSQMAQIWAAAAAAHFGVDGVRTYSGGTEVTKLNPRAVAAMERAGFEVENPGGANPHYRISYAADAPALECFSKVFDDETNPSEDFCAIMTCSEADAACPFVPGATARMRLTYDDPKAADGTPEEASVYDARCRQIAIEMLALFSRVA